MANGLGLGEKCGSQDYVNLMREDRQALDEGRFEAWRKRFHEDRLRGVDAA
jgi:queuine/archaeosine tRNA-ribosyltransferase